MTTSTTPDTFDSLMAELDDQQARWSAAMAEFSATLTGNASDEMRAAEAKVDAIIEEGRAIMARIKALKKA